MDPAPSTDSMAARAHYHTIFQYTVWSFITVVAVILALAAVVEPETLPARLTSVGVLTGLGMVMLFISSRGHTRWASWGLVVGVGLQIFNRSLHTGGIHSPATPLFVAVMMIAGLLLGWRAGIMTAMGCILLALTLAVVESIGLLPEPEFTFTIWSTWLFNAMAILLALIVQRLVTVSVSDSLRRAESESGGRRHAEQRLQFALEAGHIGTWQMDLQRGEIEADARYHAIFGLPDSADGRIALERWRNLVVPQDYPGIRENLEALRTRQCQRTRRQFRIVHPEEGLKWIEGVAAVYEERDGAVVRLAGMVMDVTAQRRAEEEREKLVRALGERVKELRVLHGAAQLLQPQRRFSGKILQELAALIPAGMQFPAQAVARIVYGEEVTTAPWPDTPWQMTTAFKVGTNEGRIDVIYLEKPTSSGEEVFLEEERRLLSSLAEILVNYLELREHQEHLEALVNVRTEAIRQAQHELARNYDSLKKLEELRDNLVHMLVHDMRSPLTVMLGRLELMEMQFGSNLPPAAGKNLQGVTAAARHLAQMTNDLLDVSRMEQGKLPLELSVVDLAGLVRRITEALAHMEKGRELTVEVMSERSTATVDRTLLERVLQNLIGNAIKHTPAGGKVCTRLLATETTIRVEVCDQGPGVPAEARTRIFEKFGAIKTRQDGQYHSVGLGLAFCRLAIEAHRGRIGVDCPPAGGSVFWFELPV
ncbi:MAG TPA: ATP-binding protein [Opitutaceae bacterium]|nr:ATP-binding protein [Opitutaceae bacterium]HRJ47911.1 ATP-binding protein [Opitutaceae bacterium]